MLPHRVHAGIMRQYNLYTSKRKFLQIENGHIAIGMVYNVKETNIYYVHNNEEV